MNELTPQERHWIATRLLARSRHQSKKLEYATRKEAHPELIKEIRHDIAECTRLALKLQEH